jgi:alanyl-tRNA synthetase
MVMERTFPQYYQNPLLSESTVRISKLVDSSKGPMVITDRTICYPEGGGQPGDRGWIGPATVLDTVEDAEGRILHYVDGFFTLEEGKEALMRLNWEHRFEYMQQHTAQHLISGILHSLKMIGTVSVHLGHDCLSIETDRFEIAPEDLIAVEDQVNEIIRQNASVSYEELPLAEAQALGLRRAIKVEGLVRLVRIGDFDIIACGGLHVQCTAQIKQVLYKGSEMIRGHVRTHWYAAAGF